MATQTPKTAPAARKLARVVPKPQSKPVEAPAASTATYRMPVDVSDWIEQAESRLRHAATEIARLKLETLGSTIDSLTDEQKKYLASWEMGT